MSNGTEQSPETAFSSKSRYATIERNNAESFLFHEHPPLEVIHSLHSIGNSRELGAVATRTLLAGNMSPLNEYGPVHLTPEGRVHDARRNVAAFLHQNNIDQKQIRLLAPERDYTTPLTIINLDTISLEQDDAQLLRPATKGDFMYTHNAELALAVRPADCPVAFVSAETPKGEVSALIHFAWLGVAHGYVTQAKEALNSLEVNWESLRVRLSAGAHAKSYRYTNYPEDPREKFPISDGLFVDITQGKEDTTYNFAIDVAAAAYEEVLKHWDITPYQLFMDTSDTAAPEVGYSSHSRTHQHYPVDGENSRDLVVARRP
ncbi:laccase domain-containing protein [Candidatus Saccharibacteria bacterium TM7i]|nr:laccase domain-containing protein [Candidatus Saccharibacteria bacterium TM7i]